MTTQGSSTATPTAILDAAIWCLRSDGFASLSTRRVAEEAGVPLSQIHYHFGSKQKLLLALLEYQNAQLLARQHALFASDRPLWQQWEQACDYLDEDLESGYVRVLNEMIAAGWSDEAIADALRPQLTGWLDLLADVARRAEDELGALTLFTPEEVAALTASAFLGAESALLLDLPAEPFPIRRALRRFGAVLRRLEDDR